MLTKVCSKCKEPKPLKEFYFRNRAEGTRQHHCIPCLTEYKNANYQKNKTSYKKRCGERRDRIKLELKRKVFDYLLEHPCISCGEKNPVVLDFHHRDPSTKLTEVTTLVSNSRSWEVIKAEIDKCDVLCSNDHRKKTAEQTHSLYLEWYPRRDSNPRPFAS